MTKVEVPEGSLSLNPHTYGIAQGEARKARQGEIKKKAPLFRTTLDKAQEEKTTEGREAIETERPLQELLDEVTQAGEALKEKPLLDRILAYKEAVRRFMQYVVRHSFDIENKTSGFNILKRKKYTLLKVIDTRLEQLAAGILSGQISQIQILAHLDEIKGLLINLLE
ncbi:MAG: YaaR family protein [Treponemataceae bacterium]|nr:YaaR family protein [Treponemataceae bacterium]